MKVVILCGGKGTRLREETEFRPKPMVPVGRFPMVWHIMKYYASFGHKEFILCLGYKGEMIKDYFRNYLWNTCDVTLSLGKESAIQYHDNHNEEDWTVTLADTGEEAMTGYRVKKIQRYIPEGERFMLTYGDGLSNINLNALVESHIQSRKTCTISAVHPTGRFGSLDILSNGIVKSFHEKPHMESFYVNGGFMVCNYNIFTYLKEDQSVMLERQPIADMLKDTELNSYSHEGFWQPMDTYQEAQYLNKLWDENSAPWKKW